MTTDIKTLARETASKCDAIGYDRLIIPEDEVKMMSNIIETALLTVRLDAMKEGMRRAAVIALEHRQYLSDKTSYTQQAILNAAQHFTEKDL